MASCSLSLLTGGAAARSSAASPSADTTQQAAPSPPNAGTVCRHRSATGRPERTWQRNRQQLPHPCQLSAPSRSHRAGTALVFASEHNKCRDPPAIVHSFLSAQLTPAQVAPPQQPACARAQAPLSAVPQLRASHIRVARQRRASRIRVMHQRRASTLRISLARQRSASASRFRVSFQRRASRISRQGHTLHIAHPLSELSFSCARPASRIARQHRTSRISLSHRTSACEHHASRVSPAHSASAKLATPQRIGAT